MSGARQFILLALAILVSTVAFTSSAQATSPAWTVEKVTLGVGMKENIAETTTVTEEFVIKGSTWGVKCPSVKFSAAFIEGEKTRKEKSIILEGCKAIGSSCKVATIETEPLTSTLSGTVGHYKLNFKPTSGTTVATITLSGAGCPGALVVTGTMACNYPSVESEAVNHVLEFTATSGTELKREFEKTSEAVTLAGKDEFWLTSKKLWSVK
jgi:hypothetical protein